MFSSSHAGNRGTTPFEADLINNLPFAQKRFAKEANIENIQFLSDYRSGEFGTRTGLLIEENRLLARAIIVLDQIGTIRYLEIVKELGHLPDMGKAFIAASSL